MSMSMSMCVCERKCKELCFTRVTGLKARYHCSGLTLGLLEAGAILRVTSRECHVSKEGVCGALV